ncbi:hypothetical protein M231_03629 [Tremella mesenterica]|uniref:Uncharacterized protein n=1 Tax=Tremella mesenterica TaxID=5217 RepID=A0A4Q1BMR7_TREME|nr:uncharacterized protein TREMEDRAFT_59436 [Tremella mesenterica DSM 1558]EIW73271.1 hypothetical protein TREMEDRAFT_59436 [Tremella mesenterica DSM 1558]RXK39124.1 hypothetical protein M231_03629 [Tremella mesenterica]
MAAYISSTYSGHSALSSYRLPLYVPQAILLADSHVFDMTYPPTTQPLRNLSPITELTTPGSLRATLPDVDPPTAFHIDDDDVSVYSSGSVETVTAVPGVSEGAPGTDQDQGVVPRLKPVSSNTPFPKSPVIPPRSPAREAVFGEITSSTQIKSSLAQPVNPGGLPPPPRSLTKSPSRQQQPTPSETPILRTPSEEARQRYADRYGMQVEDVPIEVQEKNKERKAEVEHPGLAGVGAGGRSRPASVRSRPNSFHASSPDKDVKPPTIPPSPAAGTTTLGRRLEDPSMHNIPLFPSPPNGSPKPGNSRSASMQDLRELRAALTISDSIHRSPYTGHSSPSARRSGEAVDFPSPPQLESPAKTPAVLASEDNPLAQEASKSIRKRHLSEPHPHIPRQSSEQNLSSLPKRSRKDSKRRSLVPSIFLSIFSHKPPVSEHIHDRSVRRLSKRRQAEPSSPTSSRSSIKRRSGTASVIKPIKSMERLEDRGHEVLEETPPRTAIRTSGTFGIRDDGSETYPSHRSATTSPVTPRPVLHRQSISDLGSAKSAVPQRHLYVENMPVKEEETAPSSLRGQMDEKYKDEIEGEDPDRTFFTPIKPINPKQQDETVISEAKNTPSTVPKVEEQAAVPERKPTLEPVDKWQSVLASPISPLAIVSPPTPQLVVSAAYDEGQAVSSPRPLPRPPSFASATDMAQGHPSPRFSPLVSPISPSSSGMDRPDAYLHLQPEVPTRSDQSHTGSHSHSHSHASTRSHDYDQTSSRSMHHSHDLPHTSTHSNHSHADNAHLPHGMDPGQGAAPRPNEETGREEPTSNNLPLYVASHLLSAHAAALMRQSSNMRQASENLTRMAQESLQWGGVLVGLTQSSIDAPFAFPSEVPAPPIDPRNMPPVSNMEDYQPPFGLPRDDGRKQERHNAERTGVMDEGRSANISEGLPGRLSWHPYSGPPAPSAYPYPQVFNMPPGVPGDHPFSIPPGGRTGMQGPAGISTSSRPPIPVFQSAPSVSVSETEDPYTRIPPRLKMSRVQPPYQAVDSRHDHFNPAQTQDAAAFRRAERRRKGESLPASWPHLQTGQGPRPIENPLTSHHHHHQDGTRPIPLEWLEEADRLGREGWASLRRAEEAWIGAMDGLKHILSRAIPPSPIHQQSHPYISRTHENHHGMSFFSPDSTVPDLTAYEDSGSTVRPNRWSGSRASTNQNRWSVPRPGSVMGPMQTYEEGDERAGNDNQVGQTQGVNEVQRGEGIIGGNGGENKVMVERSERNDRVERGEIKFNPPSPPPISPDPSPGHVGYTDEQLQLSPSAITPLDVHSTIGTLRNPLGNTISTNSNDVVPGQEDIHDTINIDKGRDDMRKMKEEEEEIKSGRRTPSSIRKGKLIKPTHSQQIHLNVIPPPPPPLPRTKTKNQPQIMEKEKMLDNQRGVQGRVVSSQTGIPEKAERVLGVDQLDGKENKDGREGKEGKKHWWSRHRRQSVV